MDDSPTARSLRTLDLIHNRPGITAADLAERLGVTERAVRRYVGTLRDAGVPVTGTPGRYGGYQIGRGVRLPPVAFSGTEALALVMAVVDSRAGAPPDTPVGEAVGKLLRALPESVARSARQLWQHTAAAPSEFPRPEPAITSGLVDAVAAGRRVRIGYRSAAGHEWTNEVDPWAVVVRRGLWYLLCAKGADEVRTYRVDRITSLEPLSAHANVPAELDAVAQLEHSLSQGWQYPTRVRFFDPVERVRPWLPGTMGELRADGEGCLLVGTTSNPDMYAGEWLAQVQLPFVIEGGDELVAAMRRVVARLQESLPPG
ncbi:MAG: WYL domain-containing protein [Micropruina sp.]|nr:WYL domain-containing protein [Micropruina sp.]